jgi:hypothetical protein
LHCAPRVHNLSYASAAWYALSPAKTNWAGAGPSPAEQAAVLGSGRPLEAMRGGGSSQPLGGIPYSRFGPGRVSDTSKADDFVFAMQTVNRIPAEKFSTLVGSPQAQRPLPALDQLLDPLMVRMAWFFPDQDGHARLPGEPADLSEL